MTPTRPTPQERSALYSAAIFEAADRAAAIARAKDAEERSRRWIAQRESNGRG